MADFSEVIDVIEELVEGIEIDDNMEAELSKMGMGSEEDVDPTDEQEVAEEDVTEDGE